MTTGTSKLLMDSFEFVSEHACYLFAHDRTSWAPFAVKAHVVLGRHKSSFA